MKMVEQFGMRTIFAVALLLSAVGCMVSPGDYEILESHKKPIQFTGFTIRPGQRVEIFAKNIANDSWVKIGQTESSSEAMKHFGTDWYFWRTEILVPKALWTPWGNSGGYVAILKGVADKSDLMTFKEGFYNYYEDYDSVEELFLENKSTTGVEILVWAKQ